MGNGKPPADTSEFAEAWVSAWNAHDLEAILSHFAEDVVFTSPVAARIVEGSGGTIVGRRALGEYYGRGLELIPDLRFEVIDTYAGVDTVVINYRNQSGGQVCEVLRFGDDGLVTEGHGTYLQSGPEPGA
jgi:ketosteroid isomerase-like protein